MELKMKKMILACAVFIISSGTSFAACKGGVERYVDVLYSGKTDGSYGGVKVKFKGENDFEPVLQQVDPSKDGYFEYMYIRTMLLNAKLLHRPVKVGCENENIVSVYLL